MGDSLPVVRLCAGTNRDGGPCKSALTGELRYCRQHDPETAEIAKADSARAAASRNRPITDAILLKVEADPDAVVAPLFAALEATKSWVSNGELVTVPDHETRLKASEKIADRIEGKAAQRTEITGAGGGPLELLTLLKAASIEDSF